jgi:hypothetical protein
MLCAAGLTLAWLVAAQRRLVAHAARRFAALSRPRQMLAVFAICVLTVCAQKRGTNGVSNAEILEEGRRGEKIIELANNRIGGSFGVWFCGGRWNARPTDDSAVGRARAPREPR